MLRRPRPLGRTGGEHAAESRAHALGAGGARHLLHERTARLLLRAGQVRARGARRRRAPARDGLLRGAAGAGRVGAHLSRGPRQRRQGEHPVQVGRGAAGGGELGARAHAGGAARVARGTRPRAAQRRALPPAPAQAPAAARRRAHRAGTAAAQAALRQRLGGGDAARRHGAHPAGAAPPARRRARPPARRAHRRAHGAPHRAHRAHAQRYRARQGRLAAPAPAHFYVISNAVSSECSSLVNTSPNGLAHFCVAGAMRTFI